MDFDEFDIGGPQDFDGQANDSIADRSTESTDSAANARSLATLKAFDHAWYTGRVRASRRMDLIGDYAGSEFFLIDGKIDNFLALKCFR